jgi:hypothetical protein
MKEYKIDCVGMTNEQKCLVQDALFKIGYTYEITYQKYYDGEYYFAYPSGYMYRMEPVDHLYFKEHPNTEITFNELMKLANMEEHMKFTKADLKDGMFVRLKSNANIYVKIGDYLMRSEGFLDLCCYDNELERYEDPWSVAEVMVLDGVASPLGGGLSKLNEFKYKTIWKRPEPMSDQQRAILELENKQQELIDAAKSIAEDIAKLKGN